MYRGYTGKILKVDLSTGDVRFWAWPPSWQDQYMGGRGLGARLMLDSAASDVSPLEPANLLYFLTGPITGTLLPGASKFVVVTKSPASGGFCDSYSSGRFALELKYAGLDGMAVTGKAEGPSILVINNQSVRLVPAVEFWGSDTLSTERRLKELYGQDSGVVCIGPAGENLVRFASINSDYYRQAARGGVGAVMGSKNLKAIVVRGNMGVGCADPAGVMELVLEYRDLLLASEVARKRMKYGTPLSLDITNALGMLPTRNFQETHFPEAEGQIDGDGFLKDVVANQSCLGCMVACSKISKTGNGPFAGDVLEGPEYEAFALLGSNLGVSDRATVIRANLVCDELGMDVISAGGVIGFYFECLKKGLVDTGPDEDPETGFGNGEAMLNLLKLIAHKRGVGKILAEGVSGAAEVFGSPTKLLAHHVKGLELPGYDPRGGYGVALSYAVCARGGCHRRAWPPRIELLKNIPADTSDGKAAMVKEMSDENNVFHSLLACDFPFKLAGLGMGHCRRYLKAVTGQDYSEEDLWRTAGRIETAIRLYNLAQGLGRDDDTLPPRFLKEKAPSGPNQGMVIPARSLDEMLDEYYELRGWDSKGIPRAETLAALKLDDYGSFAVSG
ncbi:MAG: aldehyde ferredoxin oxidoreductase family protein [Deltaproteobacteria bacterium]|nr:aldehyde ferredoxin oxidoreductase family protein [Deltaproteobacteria bacterium]